MSFTYSPFGFCPDGRAITRYTMTNKKGASVSVLDLGGTVQSIVMPGRDGQLADVALGFDTCDHYLANDCGYMGALIGRYGNRIAGARFTLCGQEYRLFRNDGQNCLHGGQRGFNSRVWAAFPQSREGADCLHLFYVSPDGEEGFPGTLTVHVTYTLDDDCRFSIRYQAESDKDTLVNLTNHTYFNLAGAETNDARALTLTINAPCYLPVDNALIPTGELMPVQGSAFDFSKGKTIAQGIAQGANDKQVLLASGFDHTFAAGNAGVSKTIATLYDKQSGRKMDVITDQPGVQCYTANMLAVPDGKKGVHYAAHSAVCLETQAYPDAPHQPFFPTCLLKAGQTYDTTTVYAFSAE